MVWIKSITKGRSKEIARELFLTFTTQEKVSRELYPNRKKNSKGRNKIKKIHYVEPIVNKNFKIWEKEGFIEKSRPISIENTNRWGNQQVNVVYWNIMNLNPIFKYCKSIKDIEFSQDEKTFLKLLLLPLRKSILEENPHEDIINATLKFYTKHFIMNYYLNLRGLRDFPNKYKSEKKKVKELNNPKNPMNKWYLETKKEIHKKYGGEKRKEKKWDEMSILAHDSKNIHNYFIHYFSWLEKNRKMVSSVDNKILKVLDIFPNA